MKKYFAISFFVLCVLSASCARQSPDVTEKETTADVTAAVTETEPAESLPEIETRPEEKTTVVTEKETEQTTAEITAEPGTETDTVTGSGLDFKADISAYEKYLDPEDKDGYLILVNPDNPLSETYKPSDLVYISNSREGRNDQLCLYAAKALEAFILEASANGCKRITSVSAYRPYNTQKYIFDGDVQRLMEQGYSREETIKIERKDTAYPGESEHQSGLAVDILDDDSDLYEFDGTYEAKWLAENAWKFGFILRYPKDKEEITTYVYEPWHFRYVGRYHAKRIYEMNMYLEEYIEFLKTE